MSIQFNGNVNINGNMEIYDNGSIKITNREAVTVNVDELSEYIEKELPSSVNREEYKKAANTLLNPPEDKNKIMDAITKLKSFVKESGKTILISGLTDLVQEVIRGMVQRI